MRLPIILVLCCVAELSVARRSTKPKNTLRMVSVLFRHAQRTPDVATIYPNDPYRNETYEPFGLGALTKEGFITQYNLGRALKARYGSFLGPYSPSILTAQASPYSRTRNAMQLVLAGLFPPVAERQWDTGLPWQPIDFHSNPRNTDLIFLSNLNCENFWILGYAYFKKLQQEGRMEHFEEIREYLSHNSGWNVDKPLCAFLIYAGLLAEEEWGLELPDWTKSVYPDRLHNLAVEYVSFVEELEELRTLAGGFLLKQISDQTALKMNGTTSLKKTKITLYSGHDFTIIGLLSALGVYKPELPPYASYLLMELHEIDNVYGFKVFYHNYSKKMPELLELPGCGSFCPYDKFLSLFSKYFAHKSMCTSDEFLRKIFSKQELPDRSKLHTLMTCNNHE